MAWETRNGRRYFYRTFRRPGGGVGREYLGAGAKAEAAAAKIEKARAAERQVRDLAAQMATEQAELDAQVAELDLGIQGLVSSELLAAGYYKHAGTWRHKRESKH